MFFTTQKKEKKKKIVALSLYHLRKNSKSDLKSLHTRSWFGYHWSLLGQVAWARQSTVPETRLSQVIGFCDSVSRDCFSGVSLEFSLGAMNDSCMNTFFLGAILEL
uniref:Uncharacterized protein n=1 Tax=Cacopsylla melanoneura TaxID=428564 RepID=A0A8D9BF37_9HEMI